MHEEKDPLSPCGAKGMKTEQQQSLERVFTWKDVHPKLFQLIMLQSVVILVTVVLAIYYSQQNTCPSPTSSAMTAVSSKWPAIGVLSSPSTAHPGEDYIPASYIRWVESAGAIVVPIPSGVYWDTSTSWWTLHQSGVWTEAQYIEAFNGINGLLIPGGNPWPQISSEAFQTIYTKAVEANSQGGYFPIWGTCAGFESLVIMAAAGCESQVRDGNIPQGACGVGPITRGWNSENVSLPLSFAAGVESSRMFQNMPSELLAQAASEPLTMNNHRGGVSPEQFRSISGQYKALSTSVDLSGQEFVSTMEGSTFPFFGVQWHPEKAMFEWGIQDNTEQPYEAIDHSPQAIKLSKYLADFFCSRGTEERS